LRRSQGGFTEDLRGIESTYQFGAFPCLCCSYLDCMETLGIEPRSSLCITMPLQAVKTLRPLTGGR